jgi:hypothetical protein
MFLYKKIRYLNEITVSMPFLQGSLPHRIYNDGIPDSWLFAFSESGYMDGICSINGLKRCFCYTAANKDMDNNDSHITLKVIEKELPAHTTHFLQLLDVKVYGRDLFYQCFEKIFLVHCCQQ